MLALDAVLVKLQEEINEVSIELGLMGKMASKSIRFGLDSYHPRDPEKKTNEAFMLEYMDKCLVEVHDLQTFTFLYLYMRAQFTPDEEAVAQKAQAWFPTKEAKTEAVRKLQKFDRLAAIMRDKGSISQEELDQLQRLLVNVMVYLQPEIFS